MAAWERERAERERRGVNDGTDMGQMTQRTCEGATEARQGKARQDRERAEGGVNDEARQSAHTVTTVQANERTWMG